MTSDSSPEDRDENDDDHSHDGERREQPISAEDIAESSSRGWSIRADRSTSILESLAVLAAVALVVSVLLPWYVVEGASPPSEQLGEITGVSEWTTNDEYQGHELTSGLVTLGVGAGVLALTWVRRWTASTAAGVVALALVGLFSAVAALEDVLDSARQVGTEQVVILELPDGTHTTEEAFDVGTGFDVALVGLLGLLAVGLLAIVLAAVRRFRT